MRVRRHARALSIPMPLPSTCSSLRLIHAELPRIRSALGGQTRRADGGLLLLLLLLIPRGSIHHSPPASVKQSGIPSVLGRGCASGLESVPGTITRRGAPLYLPLSPCPHRGNNHTGWGQFGYFWRDGRREVPSENAEVRDCLLSRDKEMSINIGAYEHSINTGT